MRRSDIASRIRIQDNALHRLLDAITPRSLSRLDNEYETIVKNNVKYMRERYDIKCTRYTVMFEMENAVYESIFSN